MQSILFLKDIQVANRYNLNRSTIWRWIKKEQFPKPTKLNYGSSRWNIIDLEQWERSKSLGGDNAC